MNDLLNNIKNLREITGAGFLDCKKALESNSNDIEDSIDFLRKKGLAKANKKSSREAKEGAVGVYSNENFTTIIQINTETDFAAKNEVFLDFMDEIGNCTLEVKNLKISIEEFYSIIVDEITILDKFKNIISKIGENIVLTKLIFIENSANSIIAKYLHNTYRKNIGKIAVTLKVNFQDINDNALVFGKNLCMHIAASKPISMNIENLDKELIKKEKEIQMESINANGKSEDIIHKIIEGKMKKFYSENVFLNQSYILDTDKTINEVISDFSKTNKVDIIDYNLVVLGSE